MKIKEVKEIIRDSLGLDADTKQEGEQTLPLEEAYVALPKVYKLNTELVSNKAKDAHMALYEGYVKSLNRCNLELETSVNPEVNSNNSLYRSLKIDEVYNLNAVHLHELYFANISDVHSEISIDSLAFMRLERDFGDFDRWQNDFMACCKSSRNGWAVCGFSTFLKRYLNICVDGHSANIPVGFIPVLVIDLHEHSYFRDYLNEKKDYIKNMLLELNWQVIEDRIIKCDKFYNILSH